MKTGLVSIVAITACLSGMVASPTVAAVDLVLKGEPQTIPVGARSRVELYAVSDDGTDIEFSAADVGFTWDPAVLTLVNATAGSHPWMMSGFLPDDQLDGINDSLDDGDARYTVVSISPAVADADGFLVATFEFEAIGTSDGTEVVIEPSLGPYSPTQVFGTGSVGEDVTGTLGTIGYTLASEAVLSVVDLTIPVGREGVVIVSGDIAGAETVGVTILLELMPREDVTGTVEFTPAPPPDIVQLGDPWPDAGSFSVFDTDPLPVGTGSPTRNGIVDSDGSADPLPLAYTGPLAGFPVTASGDAGGIWDVRLTLRDGWSSSWEGLMTGMYHGVLKVVDLGNGDGNTSIDVKDFSELQACFTGLVGPIDPPAYSQAPQLRCSVYDFDGDGDIDAEDYSSFGAVMLGPAP